MKEKTCCFTGRRKLPEEDLERIRALTKQQIGKLIEQRRAVYLRRYRWVLHTYAQKKPLYGRPCKLYYCLLHKGERRKLLHKTLRKI